MKLGTQEWFAEVFEANHTYILNYLFYLSGDTALAEDLVQDVFLQLWEKRSKIRQSTVRSYLYTLAKNAFLKSYRQKKYDLKFKSTYFNEIEHESPEYIMELKEFDARLQKVIANLPEKCRVIYLMSRIDGLKYAQISESLNISIKAVEKQISKALSVFRKELNLKL